MACGVLSWLGLRVLCKCGHCCDALWGIVFVEGIWPGMGPPCLAVGLARERIRGTIEGFFGGAYRFPMFVNGKQNSTLKTIRSFAAAFTKDLCIGLCQALLHGRVLGDGSTSVAFTWIRGTFGPAFQDTTRNSLQMGRGQESGPRAGHFRTDDSGFSLSSTRGGRRGGVGRKPVAVPRSPLERIPRVC